MSKESVEQELDVAGEGGQAADCMEEEGGQSGDGDNPNEFDYVETIESTPEWNQMRQEFADYMWQHQ